MSRNLMVPRVAIFFILSSSIVYGGTSEEIASSCALLIETDKTAEANNFSTYSNQKRKGTQQIPELAFVMPKKLHKDLIAVIQEFGNKRIIGKEMFDYHAVLGRTSHEPIYNQKFPNEPIKRHSIVVGYNDSFEVTGDLHSETTLYLEKMRRAMNSTYAKSSNFKTISTIDEVRSLLRVYEHISQVVKELAMVDQFRDLLADSVFDQSTLETTDPFITALLKAYPVLNSYRRHCQDTLNPNDCLKGNAPYMSSQDYLTAFLVSALWELSLFSTSAAILRPITGGKSSLKQFSKVIGQALQSLASQIDIQQILVQSPSPDEVDLVQGTKIIPYLPEAEVKYIAALANGEIDLQVVPLRQEVRDGIDFGVIQNILDSTSSKVRMALPIRNHVEIALRQSAVRAIIESSLFEELSKKFQQINLHDERWATDPYRKWEDHRNILIKQIRSEEKGLLGEFKKYLGWDEKTNMASLKAYYGSDADEENIEEIEDKFRRTIEILDDFEAILQMAWNLSRVFANNRAALASPRLQALRWIMDSVISKSHPYSLAVIFKQFRELNSEKFSTQAKANYVFKQLENLKTRVSFRMLFWGLQEVDFYYDLAKNFGREMNFSHFINFLPQDSEQGPKIVMESTANPVLAILHRLDPHKFPLAPIPFEQIEMGRGNPNIVLVLGPNQFGKSLNGKTLATTMIMGQVGAPVNAKISLATPVDFFIDHNVTEKSGDSLMRSQTSHLQKTLNAMDDLDDSYLFLILDEPYAGSEIDTKEAFFNTLLKQRLIKKQYLVYLPTPLLDAAYKAKTSYPASIQVLYVNDRYELQKLLSSTDLSVIRDLLNNGAKKLGVDSGYSNEDQEELTNQIELIKVRRQKGSN